MTVVVTFVDDTIWVVYGKTALRVPERHRDAASTYLAHFNACQTAVCAELDTRDGEVRLRAATMMGPLEATTSDVTDQVMRVLEALPILCTDMKKVSDHRGAMSRSAVDSLVRDSLRARGMSSGASLALVEACAKRF